MKKQNKPLKIHDFKSGVKQELFRIFIVIVSTMIYGVGLGWFLEASPTFRIYGGGIPGLSQLIVDIIKLANGGVINDTVRNIVMFGTIIGLNIPLFILGWFGVSKRFTIYSMISVVIQATVIGYLKIDLFKNLEPAMLAIFGGGLIGVGIGIAMKFGTSTGGFDIVSQYISLRRGKSVGQVSTVMNLSITAIGAVLNGVMEGNAAKAAETLIYTLVTLFMIMIVIDKIHTSYTYIEFNIITDYPEEMAEKIIEGIQRGVTIFDVRGGYTLNEKSMVYLIVMKFEKHKLLNVIKSVDPNAFIVSKPVSSINGNFFKRTVA